MSVKLIMSCDICDNSRVVTFYHVYQHKTIEIEIELGEWVHVNGEIICPACQDILEQQNDKIQNGK